jgi:AbrB family looped-hinge helix DNA binding protein
VEVILQVGKRGTVTLPVKVRKKYGIRPGDTFRLADLDGVLILTPMFIVTALAVVTAKDATTSENSAFVVTVYSTRDLTCPGLKPSIPISCAVTPWLE